MPISRDEDTGDARNYIENTADSVELDNDQDVNNDDWLNNLTPYQSQQYQQSAQPQYPQPQYQEPAQQSRPSYQYLEEDAVEELRSKMIEPELQSVKSTVERLAQETRQEREQRQRAAMKKANDRIFKEFPKANTIVNSSQFMQFLSDKSNPYAAENEYTLFIKAYNGGDADYVIRVLSEFANTVKKPKPSVSAEGNSAPGRGAGQEKPKQKAMSKEEYQKKRLELRSKPRSARKPGELKELANTYLQGVVANG